MSRSMNCLDVPLLSILSVELSFGCGVVGLSVAN